MRVRTISFWAGVCAIFVGALSACAGTPMFSKNKTDDDAALSWLVGCWRTQDGGIEERWVRAAGSDYLFGYSTSLKDAQIAFFEQLRVQPESDGYAFYAYPRGIGPTQFVQASQSNTSITFENIENDYPQRITYLRDGDKLDAVISLSDGASATSWSYYPCR